MAIPKILHHIWVGSELPDAEKLNITSWRARHPDWEHRLWGDEHTGDWKTHDVPELRNRNLYDRAEELVPPDAVGQFRSDVARYEILFDHGGLYVDTDTVCLRPIDDLLDGLTERGKVPGGHAWAAMEDRNWVGNTYLAAERRTDVFAELVSRLPENVASAPRTVWWRPNKLSGPKYLTPIWRKHRQHTSPSRLFFPYSYNDVKRGTVPDAFGPEVYAVHEWAHTRSLMEDKKR